MFINGVELLQSNQIEMFWKRTFKTLIVSVVVLLSLYHFIFNYFNKKILKNKYTEDDISCDSLQHQINGGQDNKYAKLPVTLIDRIVNNKLPLYTVYYSYFPTEKGYYESYFLQKLQTSLKWTDDIVKGCILIIGGDNTWYNTVSYAANESHVMYMLSDNTFNLHPKHTITNCLNNKSYFFKILIQFRPIKYYLKADINVHFIIQKSYCIKNSTNAKTLQLTVFE